VKVEGSWLRWLRWAGWEKCGDRMRGGFRIDFGGLDVGSVGLSLCDLSTFNKKLSF
jgi:hypothetical protein